MTLKITPALMAKDYERYADLKKELASLNKDSCAKDYFAVWADMEGIKSRHGGHVPQPTPLTESNP